MASPELPFSTRIGRTELPQHVFIETNSESLKSNAGIGVGVENETVKAEKAFYQDRYLWPLFSDDYRSSMTGYMVRPHVAILTSIAHDKLRSGMRASEAFAIIAAELVRVRAIPSSRLFAVEFDKESGELGLGSDFTSEGKFSGFSSLFHALHSPEVIAYLRDQKETLLEELAAAIALEKDRWKLLVAKNHEDVSSILPPFEQFQRLAEVGVLTRDSEGHYRVSKSLRGFATEVPMGVLTAPLLRKYIRDIDGNPFSEKAIEAAVTRNRK